MAEMCKVDTINRLEGRKKKEDKIIDPRQSTHRSRNKKKI